MGGTREAHGGSQRVAVDVEHGGNVLQYHVHDHVGSYRLRQPSDAQDAPHKAGVASNQPELACQKPPGGRLGAGETSNDQEEASLWESRQEVDEGAQPRPKQVGWVPDAPQSELPVFST